MGAAHDVPVVLIHGVGLDHTMWRPVMSRLATRRVITYDMIGHGNAARPPGPYTLQTFVDQLSTIVDAIGGDVDLVGFSMGSLVAEGFAVSPRAARLRRLVLLNGVHDRTSGERDAILQRVADVRAGEFAATIEPALERWFTPEFAAQHPDVVERTRRCLQANDPRAYADAYEVFATADRELAAKVTVISTPTLVATGSDDQRSTPAMAAALAASIPDATLAELPGVRHLSPLEAPDLVAALITDFTAPH